MGKIVINQTDSKQVVILSSDDAAIQGGYYDAYGEWHKLGAGEWTTDGIATRTEPSGDLVITADSIAPEAFAHTLNINSIKSDTVLTVGDRAFMYSTVKSIFLKNATAYDNYVSNVAGYAKQLEVLVLPAWDKILYQQAFIECIALVSLDTYGSSIGNNAFKGTSSLKNLIFRSPTMVTIINTNAFDDSSTYHSTFGANGTGGTLYVPQALISTYQADTKWSTILSRPNNSIAAIEGSQFEHFYADGTPIE